MGFHLVGHSSDGSIVQEGGEGLVGGYVFCGEDQCALLGKEERISLSEKVPRVEGAEMLRQTLEPFPLGAEIEPKRGADPFEGGGELGFDLPDLDQWVEEGEPLGRGGEEEPLVLDAAARRLAEIEADIVEFLDRQGEEAGVRPK